MCIFFFLEYGDHRVLHVLTHSFPTRRSSDRGTNYNQSAATPPMGRRPPPRQIPASVYSRQRLGNPKVPQPCQPPDDRSAALAATGGLAKEAEASPRESRSASRATMARAEERRVGKEGVMQCRSRWSQSY